MSIKELLDLADEKGLSRKEKNFLCILYCNYQQNAVGGYALYEYSGLFSERTERRYKTKLEKLGFITITKSYKDTFYTMKLADMTADMATKETSTTSMNKGFEGGVLADMTADMAKRTTEKEKEDKEKKERKQENPPTPLKEENKIKKKKEKKEKNPPQNAHTHTCELFSEKETIATLKKGEIKPPDLGEVIAYFISKGSTEEEARNFFYCYDGQGWRKGNGNRIVHWDSVANQWLLQQNKKSHERSKEFRSSADISREQTRNAAIKAIKSISTGNIGAGEEGNGYF